MSIKDPANEIDDKDNEFKKAKLPEEEDDIQWDLSSKNWL